MTLIHSKDLGLINFALDKSINNKQVIKFYYDNNHDQIYEILFQNSIFDNYSIDDKIIVIYNLEFIKNSKISNEEIDFIKSLKKLNNQIFITCCSDKINKDVLSFFDSVDNIKVLNKWTSRTFISSFLDFNKTIIDKKLIEILVNKLPTDATYIISELNKLLAYKSSEIDINLINNLIEDSLNNNIFKLFNYYLDNDYKNVVKMINNFEKEKTDFFSILNVLIHQLFTLKLYVNHYSINKNYELLMNDFSLANFQIEPWINHISNTTSDNIDILLKNLLELEKDIFIGKKDTNNSIKLFLLKGV